MSTQPDKIQTTNAALCWPDGVPATLPAQDRADIEELYARFAWGLDLADEELLLSAMADDGCFDHLWQGKAVGHQAILEHVRNLWTEKLDWWYGRQHVFNQFIMETRDEGVRVRCFWQIVQANFDYGNRFVFGIGTRDDRVVKRNGRWVFLSVVVNAWSAVDQVPWRGADKKMARPPNNSPPADTRPFFVQSKDPW